MKKITPAEAKLVNIYSYLFAMSQAARTLGFYDLEQAYKNARRLIDPLTTELRDERRFQCNTPLPTPPITPKA